MKLDKKLLFLSILFCCGCLGAAAQNSLVTFSGISQADAGKTMEVWNNNAVADIVQDANLNIPVKADGSFAYSFSLLKPTYFTIGYNTVYVKAGDHLKVQIDAEDPQNSVFSGSQVSLWKYLAGNASTHSGSYVAMMSRERFRDAAYVDRFIDSVAAKRLQELKAVQVNGVSLEKADIQLYLAEKARIDADVINSYMLLPFYAGFEDDSVKYQQFMGERKEKLVTLVKGICRDENLDIENVRYVLQNCLQSPIFKEYIVWTPRIEDYVTSLYCSNILDNKTDSASLAQVKVMVDSISDTSFAKAVRAKLEKVEQLAEGKDAIDMKLTTLDGKPVKLSDYRGKVICIDFWATWCGPCMRESPLFHRLAETYKANKDVVFLAISIDTDLNQWKKRMAGKTHTIPELNSTDNQAMARWNINSIPRFIIIDKNFKIANSNAPAPSEGTLLKDQVNQLLPAK